MGHLNIIGHSRLIPRTPETHPTVGAKEGWPWAGVTGSLHGQWVGTVYRGFEGKGDSEVSRFLAPCLWPFDHDKCEDNLIYGKLPDLDHKPFLFLEYALRVHTERNTHIHVLNA